MATENQINANRENAQHSTGPVTPEGKQKSSRNATKHGFTGQTLHLTEDELESYHRFVAKVSSEYLPCCDESRELLQHYINLRWSLNQILVQQTNVMALIDRLTKEHLAAGDLKGLGEALEPHSRYLRTLGTYEQRRRRAAELTFERYKEIDKKYESQLRLAVQTHRDVIKAGQTWVPADLGFVHSLEEIEKYMRAVDFVQMINKAAKRRKRA
jgi:hypothetical protein